MLFETSASVNEESAFVENNAISRQYNNNK
jgi:hypothetical protein